MNYGNFPAIFAVLGLRVIVLSGSTVKAFTRSFIRGVPKDVFLER
jgi:hypothetical protein